MQLCKCHSLLGLPIEWVPRQYPANIYLFRVNNRNTRKKYEICSELIKTSEWRQITLE